MLAILEICPLKVEMLVNNSVFEFHCMLAQPDEIKKVLSLIKTSNFKTKLDRLIGTGIDWGTSSEIEVESIAS